MVSIAWFKKACPFLRRHYVDQSTSRFYNANYKWTDKAHQVHIGGTDPKLVKRAAKEQLLNYELEHYLHCSKYQINHMTRDEYLLACSKAGLIKNHEIEILSVAHERAIARVLKAMFGKK